MTPDYRSDKMPTYEGRGRARRAWDAYAGAVNRVPGVKKAAEAASVPAASYIAREAVIHELGFWLLWHIHGGFDGLLRFGMPRSTIYKKINRFRNAFGQHPDEFEFPGISIDYGTYWEHAAEAEAKRQAEVARWRQSQRG